MQHDLLRFNTQSEIILSLVSFVWNSIEHAAALDIFTAEPLNMDELPLNFLSLAELSRIIIIFYRENRVSHKMHR